MTIAPIPGTDVSSFIGGDGKPREASPTLSIAGASEAHIGQVGGTTRIVTGAIIRPADTIAYAVGDLIGASTAANNASNIITIAGASRITGGTGRIIRIRGTTNDPTFAGTLRFHFFKTAVAPAVGDNGALAGAVANYINYYGSADVTLANIAAGSILSDGAKGFMAFSPPIAFDVVDGTSDIFMMIETRTAFTPKSGQRFSAALEMDLD